MKKLLPALLCLLLLLTACNGGGNQSSSDPLPPASSSEAETENQAEPPAPGEDEIPSIPADLAMYRGTVTAVEQRDDGALSLLLEQYPGTDFGRPELEIILGVDTDAGFDTSEIEAGNYLEVYYGAALGESMPAQAEAIVAIRLPDAADCLYNGKLVQYDADASTLLLTALDGSGEVLFHYSDETQFYLDAGGLEPGDELNVYHTASFSDSADSATPGGEALEVRPYRDGLAYENPADAVDADPLPEADALPEEQLDGDPDAL